MSFLLDTNVLSEIRKGRQGDRNVMAWASDLPQEQVFTSVMVLAEIRRGILRAERRDPPQAARLALWHADLVGRLGDRVLAVDFDVAEAWAVMVSRATLPIVDALIGATAQVHRLTMVTRNIRDFSRLGIPVLDPFAAPNKRD